LSYPLIARLYRMPDPRQHLRYRSTRSPAPGYQSVTFDEIDRGLDVEGAYLTVTLDTQGRALFIHSRFVYYPQLVTRPPREGTKTPAQIYFDLACKVYRDACRTKPAKADTTAANVSKVKPKSVILPGSLFPAARLGRGESILAQKYDYPLF